MTVNSPVNTSISTSEHRERISEVGEELAFVVVIDRCIVVRRTDRAHLPTRLTRCESMRVGLSAATFLAIAISDRSTRAVRFWPLHRRHPLIALSKHATCHRYRASVQDRSLSRLQLLVRSTITSVLFREQYARTIDSGTFNS